MFHEDVLEAEALNVKNVNGVFEDGLFYDFPYFQTSEQLPQCSSHDFLEGCAKIWIKVIFEHLVTLKWFSWEMLEKLIKLFPYKGKDSASR